MSTITDMLEAIVEVLVDADIGMVDDQEGGAGDIAWQSDNPVCYWTVKFLNEEVKASTQAHDQVVYNWSIKGFYPYNYDVRSEKFFLDSICATKNALRKSMECLSQSSPVVVINDYIQLGDGESLVNCHYCEIKYSTTLWVEREV